VSSFRTVASRDAGEELTGKYLQRVLKELTAPWPCDKSRGCIHGERLPGKGTGGGLRPQAE